MYAICPFSLVLSPLVSPISRGAIRTGRMKDSIIRPQITINPPFIRYISRLERNFSAGIISPSRMSGAYTALTRQPQTKVSTMSAYALQSIFRPPSAASRMPAKDSHKNAVTVGS